VVVPAGTGTTALFLARHAPRRCRVLAVPCVGSSDYLQLQMRNLDLASGGTNHGPRADGRRPEAQATLPDILPPPPRYSVPFGSVSPALLRSWRHARAHGVLLDLVYGPVAWAALRAHRWRHRRCLRLRARGARGGEGSARGQPDDAATDACSAVSPAVLQPTWLYIHTGGHEGLPSQLRRYARAGLLRAGEEEEVAEEVQDIWRRQGGHCATS
jgi:1-aminocyclopropane-1-carboxylate deaminase/D-cysteine desulfhydrase-like pyridoxal-dependent ACC family enzyme